MNEPRPTFTLYVSPEEFAAIHERGAFHMAACDLFADVGKEAWQAFGAPDPYRAWDDFIFTMFHDRLPKDLLSRDRRYVIDVEVRR